MTWLVALVLAAGSAAPLNPQAAIGLDDHVGQSVPAQLRFVDTAGHQVALGSYFDGKRPVVLVLAYAHCKMLCSVVLRSVADAIIASHDRLGVDYLPIVVSIDPKETPDTARKRQTLLLDEIHHSGQRALWPYLIGNTTSIHALADALGFRYVWDPHTEQFAHPAVVFLLTPRGKLAEDLRGVAYPDFDDAVARAHAGTETSSIATDILRCFHFDPSTRRYGHAMELFLRIGGATVAIGLAALIGAVSYAQRRKRRRSRP